MSHLLDARLSNVLKNFRERPRNEAPLKQFLAKGEITFASANAFVQVIQNRLGYVGDALGMCAKCAVREPLYDYLILRFIGDERSAELLPLIKMIPFIVPICATDEKEKRWIVIVP